MKSTFAESRINFFLRASLSFPNRPGPSSSNHLTGLSFQGPFLLAQNEENSMTHNLLACAPCRGPYSEATVTRTSVRTSVKNVRILLPSRDQAQPLLSALVLVARTVLPKIGPLPSSGRAVAFGHGHVLVGPGTKHLPRTIWEHIHPGR